MNPMMSANDRLPWGLSWRSNTFFIIATVGVGLFTDLFLYGLIVPVLPFMLRNRVHVPEEKIQSYVSALLAAFAAASVLFSIPAGWIADKTNARRTPFLLGLLALLGATLLLGFGSNVPMLVLARVLQGTSGAVVWTVGLAMIMDTVGTAHLGKVMGTIFSFISVGELISPVLGGILYEKTGYGGVFGVGAAILAIDFIMRLLVVETKVAARYGSGGRDASQYSQDQNTGQDEQDEEANEETALLPKDKETSFVIPEGQNALVRSFPILYCFSSPRVLVAYLVAFVQAALLATLDATIPTESQSLFGFNSLEAGLLFIPLDIPYLLLGPVAGWAVDKYGTKPAAVFGFGYLVPVLVLLRLPSSHLVTDPKDNLILYCALLFFNGIGMAVIGSPSIVEASSVVQSYDEANPGFFGKNGPYGQLYAFNSLIFSLGMTIGPIISGFLRDHAGYGNMNAAFAALCALTALLSWMYMGGKPKLLSRSRGENRFQQSVIPVD